MFTLSLRRLTTAGFDVKQTYFLICVHDFQSASCQNIYVLFSGSALTVICVLFFLNTLVTVQTCCKPHSLKCQIQLCPQIVAKFRHVSTISREKLLAILYLRTTLVSEQHKTI